MSAIPNLAEACTICTDGKPIGEHTLAEWWDERHSAPHTDLDYEENPDGKPVDVPVEMLVADTIVARAGVQRYDLAGGAKAIFPVLIFDFALGRMGQAPEHVVTVGLLGTSEIMRKVGKVLRDTANGAANAAERAA